MRPGRFRIFLIIVSALAPSLLGAAAHEVLAQGAAGTRRKEWVPKPLRDSSSGWHNPNNTCSSAVPNITTSGGSEGAGFELKCTKPRKFKGPPEAQKFKKVLQEMEVREPLKKADPAAPNITRRQVLNCQIQKWYPAFSKHTIKTKFIELSPEFVEYLDADGLILPVGCEPPSAHSASAGDDDTWSDFSGRVYLCVDVCVAIGCVFASNISYVTCTM